MTTRALLHQKTLGLALTAAASLLLPGSSLAATTCAEVRAQNPAAQDGTYSLTLGSQQVALYCHNMASTPREYLTLPNTGGTTNSSYYGRGSNTSPTGLTTWFTKVRLTPATLTLKLDDFTFSTSQGWASFGTGNYVYAQPLAAAGDCVGGWSQTGRSNIDLRGTPFDIVPGQFQLGGYLPDGTVTPSGSQAVDLKGGGICGGIGAPDNQLQLTLRSAPPPTPVPCTSGQPQLVLTGSSPLTLECGASPYSDPGAQAFDGCGNPLPVHAYNTGTDSSGPGPNISTEGSYLVSYAAWDAMGHTVNASRTVNVEDRTAPSLQLIGPAFMTHTCGSQWVDPGVQGTDACYGNVSVQVQHSGEVNGWAPGTYTVTYWLTDTGGNSATPITRTVQVANCPW